MRDSRLSNYPRRWNGAPSQELLVIRQTSHYFTQTLLVDYIEKTGAGWDIIWDERSHFREPHTGREIGLGTLAVPDYLASHRDPEIVEARIASALVRTSCPKDLGA